MYILRLDDAAEHMNIQNWEKIEKLLDDFFIKPIVGIIPDVHDPDLLLYEKYPEFWEKAQKWEAKGWNIAMHGYNHVYVTNCGGINPVNKRSEFAGLALEEQKTKLHNGYSIFLSHNLTPKIFFAPSHTFDFNTLTALKEETPIRIVSDTIANDLYYENGLYFIPQQSGYVRKLPLRLITFCYHPNTMTKDDFTKLYEFIYKNHKLFCSADSIQYNKRQRNIFDKLLKRLYFAKK